MIVGVSKGLELSRKRAFSLLTGVRVSHARRIVVPADHCAERLMEEMQRAEVERLKALTDHAEYRLERLRRKRDRLLSSEGTNLDRGIRIQQVYLKLAYLERFVLTATVL